MLIRFVILLSLMGVLCGNDQKYHGNPAGEFNMSGVDYPELPMDVINLMLKYVAPTGPDVSQVCVDAVDQYMNQLNNAAGLLPGNGWALEMFDASAKLPPAGIMQGIFHFPGNFDSCLEVEAPEFTGKHCLLTTMAGYPSAEKDHDLMTRRRQMAVPVFQAHVMLKFGQAIDNTDNSKQGVEAIAGLLKLGHCVPSVCNGTDVEMGFRNFLEKALNTGELGDWFTPEMAVPVALNCHTKDEEIEMTGGDWAMISIIVLFGILLVIGTLVDTVLNILHLDMFPEKIVQIFQGFSIYQNTLRLFNTDDRNKESLDCIHGIRFFSMIWVVFGHGYSNFGLDIFMNNFNSLYDPNGHFFGNGSFAIIFNPFPSVDSFFLIGAALLSFNSLKELDKQKGGSIKFWTMYFVHRQFFQITTYHLKKNDFSRYIRLTGLYGIIIGFHATLLKFFATDIQSHLVTHYSEGCRMNWWTNILFINNLHWLTPHVVPCLPQSWYLALDMQFYLLSPFIIYSLWKVPKIGLTLAGLLTVASTLIPTVIAWNKDFPFSMNLVADPSWIFDYVMNFYIVPWCRFQPYVVGILLGYLLHKMRDQEKFQISTMAITWLWVVAVSVGALVVYGLFPYQKDIANCGTGDCALKQSTKVERSIYNGFHRLAWSLSVSWVILACVKGAGGPVNTILACKVWIPLARMSYAIYLVHLTVMAYVNSLANYTVTMSHPLVLFYLLFCLGLSIAIAYICVVAFEAPLVHLEKLLYYTLGMGKLPVLRHVKLD